MSPSLAADAIGPVDVAVVIFEGNQFNGEVAPALFDLHSSGTIRILDLAFVIKDGDGSWATIELEDERVDEALSALLGEQFELLSEADLEEVAEDLDPNSSALVVVWENSWAARLAAAIRGSNGQVVALERIPRELVERAIEALEE